MINVWLITMNQQIQVHFHPLKVRYFHVWFIPMWWLCGHVLYTYYYKNFSMVHIVMYVEDVSGLRGWRLWLAAKQILTICMYRFNCTPLVTCTNQIVCLKSHTRTLIKLLTLVTCTNQIAHFQSHAPIKLP